MRRLCALVVLTMVGTACIPGVTAGRRCNTSDWGDDGTYALKCERGHWVRKATKVQVAQLLLAIARAKQTPPSPTIAPNDPPTPPTAPTTTLPSHGPVISSFSARRSSGPSPLTTAFGWNVADLDGKPLTCELDFDGNGTFEVNIANCTSASVRSTTFTATGTTVVVLRVSDATSAPVTAATAVSVGAASTDPYSITVRFDSSVDVSRQVAFTSAAARWAQVIKSGLSDVALTMAADDCGTGAPAFSGTVDDLLIDASIVAIDGPGGILGGSGPCYTRVSNGLPLYAVMQFDSADVLRLEGSGQFGNVVLHEMGHALGFGTLWEPPLLTGSGTAEPVFNGPTALGVWQALGGTGPIRVESTGGDGTADSHWSEATFGNELMTGYLDSGANPLSSLTIASLADIGYDVDLGAADPYTLHAFLRSSVPAAESDLQLGFETIRPHGQI